MKTLRLVPALLVTAVLLPASLVGQEAEERIEAAMDRATEAGIPTSLLESKVAEGEAKGIAMDNIAAAVEHRLDGLTRAQEALAGVPDVDADDLAVSADALESGVSGEDVAAVAREAAGERRAVAIAVLNYLVNTAGVASEEALARVTQALGEGPAALQNLPAQAAGMAGQAGPPAGIPAPGVPPTEGPPEGAGPPVDPPTGGGG